MSPKANDPTIIPPVSRTASPSARRLYFSRLEFVTSSGLLLLLAFVHFYVDGLFWAFRDPHVFRDARFAQNARPD